MRSRRRLIRARRAAARLAARLPIPLPTLPWRRARPIVELDTVRRRLELLLAAMYGKHIPIAVPERRRVGWLTRAWRSVSPFKEPESVPASDGESLRLPSAMDAASGRDVAIARYRLIAIEQAERVVRGTATAAARLNDSLERDLFLLRESATIDAAIAHDVRNLVPALVAARADALARRPVLEALAGAERDVEHFVRQLLAADPTAPPPALSSASPEESAAWARETAARLRIVNERYRGVPPVGIWGRVLPPGPGVLAPGGSSESSLMNNRLLNLVELAGAEQLGRPRPVPAESGVEPEQPAPQAGVVEQQRGIAEDDDIGSSPQPDDEALSGTGASAAGPDAIEPLTRDDVVYPEWDAASHQYRRDSVIVRARPAREASPDWATATLKEHAALVRHVRERFERLRARRTRVPRQREGDELDLAACVRALVDARTGHTIDDRLYVAVRPARRELAIMLLVDVSGSTDTLVTKTLQVIDVEKIALLIAAEALDALGDRYAMLAFSGKGARSVQLRTIKGFAERNGPTVRSRIAALAPDANTRLGAAIRHATALLDAQSAGHRLLLILSDGKPNDVDTYQGQYGIEDSRQAINEARARDVFPFCLTVDHEDSAYLKRIFGPAGYEILPRPDHLPKVLLQVVRSLLE
ncbi:MAG TPA: VWA domain-containing protein [Gemmatimonadaceae bacterium]|jgi:nitric oxide reductase NorD protein